MLIIDSNLEYGILFSGALRDSFYALEALCPWTVLLVSTCVWYVKLQLIQELKYSCPRVHVLSSYLLLKKILLCKYMIIQDIVNSVVCGAELRMGGHKDTVINSSSWKILCPSVSTGFEKC